MVYAFYRILYGEDFIKESLESILPHVDKVFIFWTDKFFGDVTEVDYKGEIIQLPKKVDNVIEIIKAMNHSKIELIYDHRPNNKNHFTERVNKYILPHYPKPKYILFMEPDFVYGNEGFEQTMAELELLIQKGYYWFSTSQIEYWNSPKYVAHRLNTRLAAIWWYLEGMDEIPPTGFHANEDDRTYFYQLTSKIYNLGFCVSNKAMYWKHLGSIAYSRKINDAEPNVMWYENKYKDWIYGHLDKDFEISLGEEHLIPYIGLADELDWLDLSEDLLERFGL